MRKFSRPFYVLALIMVMLSAVLPACGGDAPASPSPAPEVKPTAAAAAATSAVPAASSAATSAAPAAATSAGAASAPAATTSAAAPAKVVEYSVTRLTDLSGPAAVNAKYWDAGVKVAVAYWNDTAGKSLGIKLNSKAYDTRFDASVTASLWPGVLAGDKTISALAVGSPIVSALAERLAADKVPMFNGSTGTMNIWRPGSWSFASQPTWVHQTAGFLDWRLTTWKEGRPIRFGIISTQQSATFVDQSQGLESVFKTGRYNGKVEYIGTEWVPYAVTEAANEVKRLLDKKADYIASGLPTAGIVAVKRALQQYKADTTHMQLYGTSPIDTHAQALTLKDFEGDYEASSYANSSETDIDAYKIYQQYKDQVGSSNVPWTATGEVGMIGAILQARAIERAAKTVGVDKVTGEAVYNATLAGPFSNKDLLGLSGDLTISKDAAFPIANLKVRIGTVKDGKLGLATPDWYPVPDIAKW